MLSRIFFTALIVLNISSAYGAKWKSVFGDFDLQYNERIWSVVEERHSSDDVFFGLIDKSDGASFMIRREEIEDIEQVDHGSIETALAEGVASRITSSRGIRSVQRFGGRPFNVVEYRIKNPKFGDQVLVQAYALSDSAVIIIQLGWPIHLPIQPSRLPIKFEALLHGLSLSMKANPSVKGPSTSGLRPLTAAPYIKR